MDNQLIFWYRVVTAHADVRVLTHAAVHVASLVPFGVLVGVVGGGLGTLRAGRQAC